MCWTAAVWNFSVISVVYFLHYLYIFCTIFDIHVLKHVSYRNGSGVEGMFVIDSDSRARVLSAQNQPQSNSDPQYRAYRRWRSSNSSSPFRGFPNINFVEGPNRELTVTSTDVWEALVAIREARYSYVLVTRRWLLRNIKTLINILIFNMFYWMLIWSWIFECFLIFKSGIMAIEIISFW